MASSGGVLFEDIFEVQARDPDGKKFDKGASPSGRRSDGNLVTVRASGCPVSRYTARSDLYECDLTLDVNVDVYPLEVRTAAYCDILLLLIKTRMRAGGRQVPGCSCELAAGWQRSNRQI